MRFFTLLGRALWLRCPLCGVGKLFRGWLTMHPHCPHCGVKFEREPGFFLGSIYINYGLTAVIVLAVSMWLLMNQLVTELPLAIGAVSFTVLFPILLFPWARSLWLGFDQWYDAREGEAGTRR
jgi:uncharacterized protein (DUF983 family)